MIYAMILMGLVVTSWAGGPEDLGRLEVFSGSKSVYEAVAGITPFEPLEIQDPLICHRAQLKLEQIQRLDAQINDVLDRINQTPFSLQGSLLKELENLRFRRETNFEFLSGPAPVMQVQWDLTSLGVERLEQLKGDRVRYKLESYALIWENEGIWAATPDQTASLIFGPHHGVLKVLLQASVASYCDRKPLSLKIWL